MTVDIRAHIHCSLGTVLNGNFADDYLQSNGLIKTRGEVILEGTQTPTVGTLVSFSYEKHGATYTIPRVFRVLSSFADPFRRTTTVQLGCKLTYLENRKPPVTNPNSKDENEVPCAVYLKATLPITAGYVFQQCLTALGLTSDSIPLTNKFSLEEFDLTPGYVQVMSDLLQSEGFVGHLDSSETLKFLDLTQEAGLGPVITPEDVVDLGPIGSGDLPGESVIVRWSNLRLLPPDELYGDNYLERSWEIEDIFGAPSDVSVSYTSEAGAEITDTDVFYPYTFVATRYDVWDRKIDSISFSLVSSAETNNRWASDAFKSGTVWNLATARLVHEVVEYQKSAAAVNRVNLLDVQAIGGGVTSLKAALSAAAATEHTELASLCKQVVPDGADVVKSQTTYTYFSELELAGSLNLDTYISDGGSLEEFDTLAWELDSTVVVEYETNEASGISKTIAKRTVSRSQTVSGQQDLATKAQDLDTEVLSFSIPTLLGLARRQVYVGAESRLQTQKEFGLQKRPSQKDRNNSANNKPQVSESKAEITWLTGSTTSTAVTEFSIPYAPDDAISWQESGGFSSVPSDAEQKALRYGRIQNALLLGNRNGVSLQLAPEQLPKRPFDPLYLQASGITGSYRVNGTSWAFDQNGIVASTDALLWGAVSAASGTDLTTSWVPLAPGTTSLPLPYTSTVGTTDSETGVTYSAVISPTAVLVPYVESLAVEGISRSLLVLQEYPYDLNRGTSTQSVVSRSTALLAAVQGPVVVLMVRPLLGEVIAQYPAAENYVRQLTLLSRLAIPTTRIDAPLAVVGIQSTPFIYFNRVFSNQVLRLPNPAALPPRRLQDVAISPDGSKVAFLHTSSGDDKWLGWYANTNYTFTLQAAPNDQPLANGRLEFSPGGQYLLTIQAFYEPYYLLFAVTPSGFSAIPNAFDVAPTSQIVGFKFSPDDAYLAIAYGNILRIFRRQASAFITVTTTTLPSTCSELSWSPDSSMIAIGFNSAPYAAVYSFDGSALTLMTTGIAAPATPKDLQFSAEGDYLAISFTTDPMLRFYKRSGTTFTQLTTSVPTLTSPALAYAIGWSVTGRNFIMQGNANLTAWNVNPVTNVFTEVSTSSSLGTTPYDYNSLAVWPRQEIPRRLATGGTITAVTRLSLTASSFDPNAPDTIMATNALPRLGSSPATSYAGWSLLVDESQDDVTTSSISLPFNVTIDGVANNTVFVNSNSFLTFGAGSTAILYDATYPTLEKIPIIPGDYSYQRVYVKSDPSFVLLRYEGYRDYTGIAPGDSDIVWEVALVAPNATTGEQKIEFRLGLNGAITNSMSILDTVSVCSQTSSLASITGAINSSYVALGNSTGTSWAFTSGASFKAI